MNTTRRILIVFRDYPEGEALRKCLELFGCTVDVATKGLEALRLMRRYPYHLLITEVIVDELSGLALHMFAKQENPSLKTVALNKGGRVLRDVAEQFGIEHVMNLPVETHGLCGFARGILNGEI